MAQKTFALDPQARKAAAGLDWQNLTIKEIIDLVRSFLSLFRGGPVSVAEFKAAHPDCPDHVCERCCRAIEHALQIIVECADCCAAPAASYAPPKAP